LISVSLMMRFWTVSTQEHAAGLQAAFLANVFRRNVQHTGF